MHVQSDSSPNKDNSEETVVTPAGRVPKGQVTSVTPGQIIHRNPDGTYTIIDSDGKPPPPQQEK